MIKKANIPFLPDLTRFVEADGAHARRTDLSDICIANYRFNQYDQAAGFRIIDRAGLQDGLYCVTGSTDAHTDRVQSPVNLLACPDVIPSSSAEVVNISYSAVTNNEKTRAIRPFNNRIFDFNDRNREFFLQEDLKKCDFTSDAAGRTYILRFRYNPTQATPVGTEEVIFSISEYNKSLLTVTITAGASPTTDTASITSTVSNSGTAEFATLPGIVPYVWYTTTLTLTPTSTSAPTAIESEWRAFSHARLDDMVYSKTLASSTWVSLTSPKLFIGYGDPNSSPASSFEGASPSSWGRNCEIAEIAIFNKTLDLYVLKAIGMGWADSIVTAGVDHPAKPYFFPRYTSGIDSRSIKQKQRIYDDSIRAYPSISRSGDQRTLGATTAPFNDTNTIVWAPSGSNIPTRSVVFPDMIASDRYAQTTAYTPNVGTRGQLSSYSKTPLSKKIIASGSLKPGLMNKEVFLMNRLSPGFLPPHGSDGLADLLEPYKDNRLDTSAERINTPATPESTMLGFNQKLGDRIAIVVELTPGDSLTMGHVQPPSLLLTGSGTKIGIPQRLASSKNAVETIAYFNFREQTWQSKGGIKPYGWDNVPTTLDQFSKENVLAFSATTGFVINPDEADPLLPLKSRARPTDFFGFPFDEKYEASTAQTLDMSEYISAPFLLEKVEIEHQMEFLEAGDDSLGYIIRDKSSTYIPGTAEQPNLIPRLLAVSSSSPTLGYPSYARTDRTGTTLAGVDYQPGFMSWAGVPTSDNFTYGRFPLMGGMHGVTGSGAAPGISRGTLIPSQDSQYSTVQNTATSGQRGVDADDALYTSAVKEGIPVDIGQTPGGAAFWRCDTFFLMRQTVGRIDRSDIINIPAAITAGAFASQTHVAHAADTDSQPSNAAMLVPSVTLSLTGSLTIRNKSSGSIRELITYSQIAHYGYVRASSETQAHKSGSAWAETHPLRAGALPPNFSETSKLALPLEFGSAGGIGDGSFNSFTWAAGNTNGISSLLWCPINGLAPSTDYNLRQNAVWPNKALYSVLGVNTGSRTPYVMTGAFKYGNPAKSSWAMDQSEAGGGSLVSNPLYFVSEAEALGKTHQNNDSNDMFNQHIAHGATDFFEYGGFELTGSITNDNLLGAGLGRELNIKLSDGERFIKLIACDPSPAALGWADIPSQTLAGGSSANPGILWETLRPTSAYLVATASRDGTGAYKTFNTLNSGSFKMLSSIKNSGKVGATAGVTIGAIYPQKDSRGSELLGGTSQWTLYKPTNIIPLEGGTWLDAGAGCSTLETANPQSKSGNSSFMGSGGPSAFPRDMILLYTTPGLENKNPSNRSIGLSSGRSYAAGVSATTLTNQYLPYAPITHEVSAYPSDRDLYPAVETTPVNNALAKAGRGSYGFHFGGGAQFVQTQQWKPIISSGDDGSNDDDLWGASPQQLDAQYTTFQFLPFALGCWTESWWFRFGYGFDYLGAQDERSYYVAIDAGQVTTNVPFSTSVIQKTSTPLSTTYEDDSPYLLMPHDKLVLGFQPAIGGMNEGSPKPVNVPMQPWSLVDELGWRGIKNNNYDRKNVAIAAPWWANVPDLAKNEILYTGGQNRTTLSEQIRQTILKSGYARLVLYGTLLRDKKPLPAELNQPLTSLAVHEALHSDNPIVDQFQVATEAEYKGSYLTQHITGSLLKDPSTALVDSTAWDEDLGFKSSFQRFVTLPDENEVYWDSVLPDMYEIWAADDKSVASGLDVGLFPPTHWPFISADISIAATREYFVINPIYWPDDIGKTDGTAYPTDPQKCNGAWPGAFPFEQRYSTVKRILLDPGDQSRYDTKVTLRFGVAGSSPTGVVYTDPSLAYKEYFKGGWLKNKSSGLPGLPLVSVMHGPDIQFGPAGSSQPYSTGYGMYSVGVMPGGPSPQNTGGVHQARSQIDKANAAIFFGFTSDGKSYLNWGDYLDPTAAFVEAQYGPMRKTLNLVTGSQANTIYPMFQDALLDHPHGVKYGLKNYVWEAPTAHFRSDRYGQLRDMLEQRRYSKFFSRGYSETSRGELEAAVSCIFVDRDGRPLEDSSKTSCQNVSTFMTSSLPYFEGAPAIRTPSFSPFVSVNTTQLTPFAVNSPSILNSYLG